MRILNFFKKNKFKNNERSFSAALLSRLTSDWVMSFASQDAEIRSALKSLRGRARDLGRNDDYVRSYLRTLENNVVGRGVRLQANVRDSKGNSIPAVNTKIENEWKRWTRKDSCDAEGIHSFSSIERLLIRNLAETGEIFVRFVFESFGRSKVKLALQIIESDLLDENFNGIFGNNVVRMGVEQNSYGRPIAFHFLPSHPGDKQFPQNNKQERIRVPSDEVIHLFRPERPIQSRGFTWLVSAMLSLNNLKGFVDATIIGRRIKAAVMGFITNTEGELTGTGVDGAQRVEDFSPGKMVYLGPGEQVQVPSLGGESNDFDPFSQAMARRTASGVGISSEELTKDYSRASYSSSRLALITERDNWKIIQQYFIENFHQIVFEKFLFCAFASGVFTESDYPLNPEKYENVKWLPRGWEYVDPLKDVNADKEALKAGIKTFSDVLADEGKDLEEHLIQLSKERELLKKYKITSDVLIESIQDEKQKKELQGYSDEN